MVTIKLPDNYKGYITAYNCPNLKENEFCEIDTLQSGDSELGKYGPAIYSPSRAFINDSLFYAYTLPYAKDQNASYKNGDFQVPFSTNLSDIKKKYTDCYVPWGYYDRFSQLRQFQAFRSLKELDLSSTIWLGLKEKYLIYESNAFLFYPGNIILLLLFYLLLLHYNKKLRIYNRNVIIRVFLSLLYSFITTSVCLLAWLSFYWLSFNIIFFVTPYLFRLIVSIIIGGIAALLCLGIILKPNFWTWLKNGIWNGCRRLYYYGIVGFIKSLLHGAKKSLQIMWVSIKRHKWGYLSLLLIAVVGSIAFNAYQDGKNRRERYLNELSKLDIAKVPTMIDALEKQHGSVLYPFFTDSLNNLKQEITSSGYRITPEKLNYIAASNGIDLSATRIDGINAISNDGYGLCIRVKNMRSGLEQMVYYNFLSESIDTITSKYSIGGSYESKFSPSGKTLICYTGNDAHGFIYNVNTRKLKKTPEKFPYGASVELINDNDYFYLDNYTLYKGSLNSKTEPSIVRDFDQSWDYIHVIDSENILTWETYPDKCIIYNLKQDSIIYRSKEHNHDIIDGDIRGVNSEYVVSRKGVYDFKQDSLIFVSYIDMYMWNNRPIKISREDNKLILQDINGKVIKTIIKDSDDSSYGFNLRNNYIYTNSYADIFIYNLGAKLNRRVKITDYDKKVFDLE